MTQTLDHNYNLKKAQSLLDLTQKDFGIYAGVSVRTVNSWFTGDRQCPDHVSEMILRLAKVDAKSLENDEPTTDMRRWAVITSEGSDEYMTVWGSRVDALRDAESQWSHLTDAEKAKQEKFEVVLIHCQLTDQGFAYYIGEDGLADADVYEVAKDYLQ